MADDDDTPIFETNHTEFHTFSLKTENELYDEKNNKPTKTISIKRIKLPKNGEKWNIYNDNILAFSVNSTNLTLAEREFLRSPEGFKFLISEFKAGTNSTTKLKKKLKILRATKPAKNK